MCYSCEACRFYVTDARALRNHYRESSLHRSCSECGEPYYDLTVSNAVSLDTNGCGSCFLTKGCRANSSRCVKSARSILAVIPVAGQRRWQLGKIVPESQSMRRKGRHCLFMAEMILRQLCARKTSECWKFLLPKSDVREYDDH